MISNIFRWRWKDQFADRSWTWFLNLKWKTGIEFLKTSQTIIPISGEKSTSKVQPIWIFLPCEEISSILASVNFSFETKFDEKLI